MPDSTSTITAAPAGRSLVHRPVETVERPAARAFIAAPQALRKIRFETSTYTPDHVVTIRSNSEGWTNDTFGTYRDGAWEFFFEIPGLPPTLAFKFVLDGEHWMQGADLVVSTSVNHSFDENAIQFPARSAGFGTGSTTSGSNGRRWPRTAFRAIRAKRSLTTSSSSGPEWAVARSLTRSQTPVSGRWCSRLAA